MNRRQAKKRYKQLCRKYGPRISETYTDGHMTKEETKRVKQSLRNIEACSKVASFIHRETKKYTYTFNKDDDKSRYERELQQFLFTNFDNAIGSYK